MTKWFVNVSLISYPRDLLQLSSLLGQLQLTISEIKEWCLSVINKLRTLLLKTYHDDKFNLRVKFKKCKNRLILSFLLPSPPMRTTLKFFLVLLTSTLNAQVSFAGFVSWTLEMLQVDLIWETVKKQNWRVCITMALPASKLLIEKMCVLKHFRPQRKLYVCLA